MTIGLCIWSDWRGDCAKTIRHWEGRNDYDIYCSSIGMLLDLDDGTLSVYHYGRKLGTLKDGLAGEYCWTAQFCSFGDVTIQRGYNAKIV